MALTNLRSAMVDQRLRLPIGDKTFIVPKLSAASWLWLETFWPEAASTDETTDAEPAEGDAVESAEPAPGSDISELELYERVLGKPLYDEMVADGLSIDELRMAGVTAMMDVRFGRLAAVANWEAGGTLGNPTAPKLTEEKILSVIGATRQTLEPDTAPTAAPSTPSRARRSGASATTNQRARAASTRGRGSSKTGT